MTESCHKDQVHLCSSSTRWSDKNHGRSTSQMYLKKIVDFISFHSSTKPHPLNIQSGQGHGISIDLNLRLGGPSFDDLEYESRDGLSACSGVGEEKRECDEPKEPSNSTVSVQEQEAREEESSEITHLQEVEITQAPQQTEDEDKVINGKRKVVGFDEEDELQSKYKRHGCLDLLVEAAKLVSGDFHTDANDDNDNDDDGLKKPSPTAMMDTQTQCNENETAPPQADTNWFDCYGGIEVDMSPLVRSKRGRNQVLPSRYRDSVLEPLRKVTTTKSSRLSASKQKSRK